MLSIYNIQHLTQGCPTFWLPWAAFKRKNLSRTAFKRKNSGHTYIVLIFPLYSENTHFGMHCNQLKLNYRLSYTFYFTKRENCMCSNISWIVVVQHSHIYYWFYKHSSNFQWYCWPKICFAVPNAVRYTQNGL